MTKKIYVGSLSFDTTAEQIEELIGKSGEVESVSLITDKYSGKSKGFAFVEMASEEDASKAIAENNGTELDGRTLVVNEAKPQRKRNNPNRGNFGGNSRPGGGGFNHNKRDRKDGRGRY